MGLAWLLLCASLTLHVADEALTDFLSLYNPIVEQIRASYPLVPLPTFSFAVWLGLLIAALSVLYVLTPFAWGRARWLRPLAYVFAVVMLGNGMLHVIASLLLGRAAPGVVSSPLLIASAIYLFWALRATRGTA